jgi:hypothetical protein
LVTCPALQVLRDLRGPAFKKIAYLEIVAHLEGGKDVSRRRDC